MSNAVAPVQAPNPVLPVPQPQGANPITQTLFAKVKTNLTYAWDKTAQHIQTATTYLKDLAQRIVTALRNFFTCSRTVQPSTAQPITTPATPIPAQPDAPPILAVPPQPPVANRAADFVPFPGPGIAAIALPAILPEPNPGPVAERAVVANLDAAPPELAAAAIANPENGPPAQEPPQAQAVPELVPAAVPIANPENVPAAAQQPPQAPAAPVAAEPPKASGGYGLGWLFGR